MGEGEGGYEQARGHFLKIFKPQVSHLFCSPFFFLFLPGVFIAKSDVGVGTIVGSAVFNILVIVGLCGLFTATVCKVPGPRGCWREKNNKKTDNNYWVDPFFFFLFFFLMSLKS